jgi:septum site-determining protein MinD
MDVGLRNVDIVLGVSDKAVMHFGDVLKGGVSLEDALISRPDLPNLSILAAPGDYMQVDADELERMIAQLSEMFDFVWLDGPAGISDWVRTVASLSDTVIAVATPDVVSVRDASRVSEMLDELGKDAARLVVNRVRPRLISAKGALYVDDIMDGAGMPLLGIVPEDERVIAAANKGEPLAAFAQDGAAMACRNIALRLTGARVPLGNLKVTSKAHRAFLDRLNMREGEP